MRLYLIGKKGSMLNKGKSLQGKSRARSVGQTNLELQGC
jgi:hypothetical protein